MNAPRAFGSELPPANARYRIEDQLGQGGIGVVYAVWDTATERRVALKRLLTDQARELALFEREYRTLASLKHPGIVEVYEYGLDAEGPYYTMELLEGADLRRAAPMPWRQVCECMRDIASIVGVLHARRLVHRDLSPRNVWRTPDGRIKLLDFGALARFGAGTDPIGTPPLVAPEVLNGDEVDQRADLFSLGALGYWLLTTAHAFRAQNLGELPRLWEHDPPRPSGLVKLLSGTVGDLPEGLDGLLLSLLRRNKNERPTSTVELVESLNALADLPSQAQDGVASAVLASKAFVGRGGERAAFRKRLRRASQGRTRAVLVTGPEGIGRSRLLDDLAESARVAGALVVRASAGLDDRPYAAASALCVQLLKVGADRVHAVAAGHAAVLRQVSPELEATLEGAGLTGSMTGTAARHLKQNALRETLCAPTHAHTLVLVVDDLHRMDEASRALLSGLPHVGGRTRLLVLASSCTDSSPSSPTGVEEFARGARRMHLSPLTDPETLELMQSVFAGAPHVERIAARLHQRSGGNPQHCLLMAQHLVDTRVARYAQGRWDLPKDVPEEGLPAGRSATLLARLDALDTPARSLARALSALDSEAFTADVCDALTSTSRSETQEVLLQLVSKGVVEDATSVFRFAHAVLPEALRAELAPDARAAVDLRLAGFFEALPNPDIVDQLRASVHYLRAGELQRGHALLAHTTESFPREELEQRRLTAPLLAEAVDLLTAAGRDDRSMLLPLAFLCSAGYYVDPSYATRFAERGMRALLYAVPTGIARRLRALVGKRLALFATLIVCGWRLRRLPHPLKVPTAVRALIAATAALAGTEATRSNPKLARRYSDALQPLAAMGENHIARVACDLATLLAMASDDTPANSIPLAEALIARLESPVPIQHLQGVERSPYICSAAFMLGVRSIFLGDETPLRMAEKLDAAGPLYSLNADQIRAMYYTNRGDLKRADFYRRRMGVQSIQMGMSWRVDAFAPAVKMPAKWANDALLLSQAADQLERLSVDMPGYQSHARAARAAYHVARGKPQEAVSILEEDREEPLAKAGWADSRGVLASGYNGIGEYAKALAVCDDALSYLRPEDLEFVGLNINVQVERCLALAGLGRLEEAKAKLDDLLARYTESQGPLLRSYLHRARARVALTEPDYESCGTHLTACDLLAREMNMPSLLAWVRDTGYQLRLAQTPEVAAAEGMLRPDDVHLGLRTQMTLRSVSGKGAALHREMVRLAQQLTEANVGYFVTKGETGGAVSSGTETPRDIVLDWARERLGAHRDADDTTDDATADEVDDPNTLDAGDMRYCLCPFWAAIDGEPHALGALVLGFRRREVRVPAPEVLNVMLDCLLQEHATEQMRALERGA